MLTEQILTWGDIKPILLKAEILGVDTETNALDCRDGRGYATGMSIATYAGGTYWTCYLPYRHDEDNLEHDVWYDIKDFFKSYSGVLVFHNAKFDLVSLTTLGINWTGVFFDTMLMCHLINENFPFAKDLTSCVKYYIDNEESKKDDDRFKRLVKIFGWGHVPVDAMTPYACHDAALTLALYFAILDKFNEEVPAEYWQHKQDFMRVVIKMESRGVGIDVALCEYMTKLGSGVLEDLNESIGGNIGSSIFLGELLLNKLKLPVVKLTPAGAPCFDKYAMEEYELMLERTSDPTADSILTYRGWQKSVSSNYRPYVELLSPDGRLRPNYKLQGTKTGRMSCEQPNLQQIPKISDKQWNGRMKAAFVPREGYELWEFDYSQLELRLGTAYAKELELVNVFAEGRDIFTEMSQKLEMSRQDTKTFVYSVQYGAGLNRISNVFRISMEQANDMRENYRSAYPEFTKITLQASNICRAKGKVKIWSGRYRHFWSKKDDAHKAFNSLCQGGAADIVESVMVRLFDEVDNDVCCRMLLQVHDSVLFELRKDIVGEYVPKIKKIMSDVRPNFGVVFAVEAKKWGE